MRCCLLIVALVLGCGEPSQAPAALGGAGGPIDVTGMNGETGGSSGGGGAGGGAGGEAAGACDNASDLEALAIAGSVRDVARDCGSEGAVPRCDGANLSGDAYETCISACVANDVQGLSGACAGCYGAMERCALDSFCQLRCRTDTCDPICLSCLLIAGCIEELEVCRGIPGDECPG
jgi:hypothetical protein